MCATHAQIHLDALWHRFCEFLTFRPLFQNVVFDGLAAARLKWEEVGKGLPPVSFLSAKWPPESNGNTYF